MEPFWKKFPTYPRASMGWRMGGGQGYLEEWRRWFIELDSTEQQRYISDNPEPPEWQGFYQKLLEFYSQRKPKNP